MSGLTASSSLYTSGDLVLQYPIQACTTFLFVLLLTSILEYGIDYAAEVRNKYFQLMFNAVNQEVMIVGILVLSMNFATTLSDWPAAWIGLFQWAMMCLFFMAFFFVTIIIVTLAMIRRSFVQWRQFEQSGMDADPATFTTQQRQLHAALQKFHAALVASGYDPTMKGMVFADYIVKLVRRNVVALTDLTWISWVCLATLVIVNTLRSELTRYLATLGDENIEQSMSVAQRIGNYMSFVIIIGYGTLVAFLVIYRTISTRLDEFLTSKMSTMAVQDSEDQAVAVDGAGIATALNAKDNLEDPRSKLFRRSREATLELVQVTILFFEWYTAFFYLSFSSQCVRNLGPGSIPLLIAAVAPVLIMGYMLPWLITMITILSSLGTSLDDETCRHLVILAGVPQSEWPAAMKSAVRAQQGLGAEEEGRRTMYLEIENVDRAAHDDRMLMSDRGGAMRSRAASSRSSRPLPSTGLRARSTSRIDML